MASTGPHFGRYRLAEEIGSGGMAVVYRAIIDGPKGFAREIVIKRILREYSREPSFVNMLASEARLCGLLRHPAIVQVHEFGEVNNEYYLAMELVDGADLHTVFKAAVRRNKPLSAGLVCHIIAELASALAYAHSLTDDEGQPLGIVHRDISPSNVMISKLGGVKLLDFGIAKAASQVRDERTRTGTLKGKLSYMSPEQADGLAVDRRSDIFALGVMFHECLTMQRLFKGQSDFETLRLVREARVAPPSTICPSIDPELDVIVLKMLARDPADRYASGDEVAAALAPIVHRHHADATMVKRFLADLGPLPDKRKRVDVAAPIPSEPDEDSLGFAPAVAERTASAPDPIGTVTGSLGEVRPPTNGLQLRPRSGVAWWMAGIGALVVAGWALLRPGNDAPTRSTASVAPISAPPSVNLPAPPSVTPVLAAPARVKLKLEGTAGAEVLVDGRLIGELPLDIDLPSVDRERNLVVQRAGYASWNRVVAGDAALALTVNLQARKKPAAAPAAQRKSAVAQPAAKVPAAHATPAAAHGSARSPEIVDPFKSAVGSPPK